MEGWIKLHRRIIKWDWADDPKTFSLFIHLILMANHEEKEWKGERIMRGQLITGRKNLARQTGLSEQSIRTSLRRLQLTNNLTIKTTNKNSIITITNYDSYQAPNQPAHTEPTGNQPQTRSKEIKNKRNNINIYTPDLDQIYAQYPRKEGKKKGITKLKSIIKSQEIYDRVMTAVQFYAAKCEAEGTDKKYIKQFSSFVSVWEDYFDAAEQLENERRAKEERKKEIETEVKSVFNCLDHDEE